MRSRTASMRDSIPLLRDLRLSMQSSQTAEPGKPYGLILGLFHQSLGGLDFCLSNPRDSYINKKIYQISSILKTLESKSTGK